MHNKFIPEYVHYKVWSLIIELIILCEVNSNAKASVEYAAKGFIIRSGFNSNIKGKTLITVLGTTPPDCPNPQVYVYDKK